MALAVDGMFNTNKKGYKTQTNKGLNFNIFLPLMIVFILSNSADPGEMLPYAAFHMGLHCLPKYLFNGIQN